MIWTQVQEEALANTFQNESNEIRKMQKELLHYYAMKEFDRLGEQKSLKLSDKECDQECLFCHPELALNTNQPTETEDFKKN